MYILWARGAENHKNGHWLNAWHLRLKPHICHLCQIYIFMEKDISAMFFLINHVRFDLLTLRSCLFYQDQIQSILCSFLYFSQVIRPSSCKLVIIGVGYISDLFFLYSNTFMIIFSQSCISNWLIQNKHLPLPFQMFAWKINQY